MNGEAKTIDHLMINVPNSALAGETYKALGFSVAPRSEMPGLSNCLVCFPEAAPQDGICNYLELMSLDNVDETFPPMPVLLSKLGPVSTVISTDDSYALRDKVQALGLEVVLTRDLQRDWLMPSGEIIQPAFQVMIPKPGQAPLYWNACTHKTAPLYMRHDFTNHANGVRKMTSVIAVAENLSDVAAHFEALWSAEVTGNADHVLVRKGAVSLEVYSPSKAADLFLQIDGLADSQGLKGVRLATDNLSNARAIAETVGVSVVDIDEGFAIPPSDAAGTLLIFEAAH